MRWLSFVAALAGCDKIIGLDRHDPGPGPGNEDGDHETNDDDNCPGINNDQTDTDDDGVGDVCDPAPMTPGDRIAVFYGFDEPDDPRWFRDGGNWAFVGGQLVYSSEGEALDSFYTRNAPKLTPPYVIEAHFTFDKITAFSVFGVTANLDDFAQGAACSLRRQADGTDRVEAYWVSGEHADIAPIEANDGYRVRFTVASPTINCDIRGDIAGKGGAASNDTFIARPGYVGFGTLNAVTVRVDYLVVYAKE